MLIPKSALSIRNLADTESSRYALGGVKFCRDENGKPLAIACDGRRLGVASWSEADGKNYPSGIFNPAHKPDLDVMIPVDAVAAAEKLKTPKGRGMGLKPILQNVALDENQADPNKVQMAASDAESVSRSEARLLEGRFPRWQDALPVVDKDTIHVNVNAKMLMEMLAVAVKHTGDEENLFSVTLSFYGTHDDVHNHGFTVTSSNSDGRKFHGVQMPICPDKSVTPALAWHALGKPLAYDPEEGILPLPDDSEGAINGADANLDDELAAV